MAFVGSDVQDVTYSNSVLGQGSLFCKAGESSNIDLGGLRSTDDKAMVTGNGKRINQSVMQCSHFELPPIAWDKTDKDELKKLSDLAGARVGTTWTVSFVDGTIYQMQNGYPVGDIKGDGYAGTIPLVLQGDAYASKIS
jgi:hypothetical protein